MKVTQKLRMRAEQAVFVGLGLAERLRHGQSIDLFSSAFRENLYAAFERVRERGPIFYSLAIRAWWVTGFDLVREVLRDKRFSSDIRNFEERANAVRKRIGDDAFRLESFENPSMLNLDPPDHSRIRKLATHAFTQKYVASLEPRVEQVVDRCLDSVGDEHTADIMEALAKPLPAIVIAEMMCLPETDHAAFQSWSEDLIAATATGDPEVAERGMLSSRALIDYFAGIVEERRGAPGDGYSAVCPGGHGFSRSEAEAW